jgi:hypothetical protein
MKKILSLLMVLLVSAFAVNAAPSQDNPSLTEEEPLNPIVPLHEWRMLGNGQINGYQYDDQGNLLYVIHGVPGVAEEMIPVDDFHHGHQHHKFLIDANKIPNNAKFKNGYVHFHPAAVQDENNPGIEGFFLKHTAVTTGFEFPPGRLVEQQGIDFGFPNNYEII